MKRILLVEDEEPLRDCISQMLRLHGYTVYCATGNNAFSVLGECPGVDLLITDVLMPGVNGVSLAQHIRKEQPDFPVIFISGQLKEAICDRFPELSAAGHFLQKPFKLATLASHATRLIRSKAARKMTLEARPPALVDPE